VETAWIRADEWLDRARALASEGWELRDLAGVDTSGLKDFESRFEIVVQLLHSERRERATLHVMAAGDPPDVPSVVSVWPTANNMEREAYDMFGIVFENHPNLTRILMPDEWEGHPLRKDYGVGKVPVEFKPQPFLQIEGPGQAAGPDEARRDVDHLGQIVPERAESDLEPESERS
jgi:NADH:ubiquinone oxidoreductase subunit C